MTSVEAKERILERVRSLAALVELRGDPSLGAPHEVAAALRELILSGELGLLLAHDTLLVKRTTDSEKRRRLSLRPLTERVIADMKGRGDDLEQLADAVRIVDAIER